MLLKITIIIINMECEGFIMKKEKKAKEKKAKEKKRYYIICIVLCLLILAPLLIIGIYNRPSADDFDYAFRTHQAVLDNKGLFGIIKAAWDTNVGYFYSWQGLYSSAFLLALQPAIFGEKYYALTVFIIIGLIFLFLLLAINMLNKMFIKKSFLFSITSTLIILTLLMLWLPSATEGLYWYNGAMNYTPWFFTNIFNFCLLLYIKDKPKSLKLNCTIVISTILSFLTSGGNHVTAFANILLLIILSTYFILKKKYHTIFPLLAAIIGFIIMYTAPGTAARAAAFESLSFPQPSVLETIVMVILKVGLLFCEWINIQWLLSLVIITPIGMAIIKKNKDKFSFPLLIIILLSSGLVICGMLAVPYYAMGGFGEGRLINVVWLTFMVLSWLNYILLLGLLVKKDILNLKKLFPNKYSPSFCVLVICLGLCLSTIARNDVDVPSNSVRALIELKNGTAKDYCNQVDSRYKIFNNPEIKEASVPPIKSNSMLFFADVGKDPNVWPNTSISMYYGKQIYVSE